MKLSSFIIGLLMFGVVVSIFYGALIGASSVSTYNMTIDPEFKAAYTKLNSSINGTDQLHLELEDKMTNSKIDSADGWDKLSNDVIDSIKYIKNSYTFVNTMTQGVQEKLGIPTVYYIAFITIVLLFIMFGFIAAIMKWEV